MSFTLSPETNSVASCAKHVSGQNSFFRRVLFITFTMAILSAGLNASAQTPPQSLPPTTSVPSDCEDLPIDGAQFMQRVNSFVVYGHLTDIKYIENELGTKLNLTSGYEKPDGMSGDFKYEANQLFEKPVQVSLNIATFFGGGTDSALAIGGWPPTINIVDECFRVPLSTFVTYFGKNFSIGYMGGQEIWSWYLSGPNNSTVSLSVTANGNKIVNGFAIDQMTPSSPAALHAPPPFCRKFTLTDAKFLDMLDMITNHGDITDIAFMERALGTKLSLTPTYGEDGSSDPDTTIYRSDHLLDAPIPVEIDIFRGKDRQDMGGESARMRLSGPDPDFYFNCLKLTMAEVFSSFARRNLSDASRCVPTGDCGEYVWKLHTTKENDARQKLLIGWEYNGNDSDNTRVNFRHQIVTNVEISQSPH